MHMAFNNVQSIDRDGTAGLSIDVQNPAHVAYAGAAVVGGTAVVGSVVVTGMVAPGIVLVPAAVGGALCAVGHHISNRDNASTDAPKTDTAAA